MCLMHVFKFDLYFISDVTAQFAPYHINTV